MSDLPMKQIVIDDFQLSYYAYRKGLAIEKIMDQPYF